MIENNDFPSRKLTIGLIIQISVLFGLFNELNIATRNIKKENDIINVIVE
jgi:hypothetical protein